MPPLSTLARLSTSEQRSLLGERLYPLVTRWCITRKKAPLVAKLTGMLLELDTGLVLAALDDPALLGEQLQRAISLIEQQTAPHEPPEATDEEATDEEAILRMGHLKLQDSASHV